MVSALSAAGTLPLSRAARALSACPHADGSLCFTDSAALTVPPPNDPAHNGSLTASCPTDSQIVDIAVTTASLQGIPADPVKDVVHVRLLLPPGTPPSAGWPVLYLLPGVGSSFMAWSCDTFLDRYVNGAPMLVVSFQSALPCSNL